MSSKPTSTPPWTEKQKAHTLSAAQYWEWRTTIAELDSAKHKLIRCELEHKFLGKEAEMLLLRAQLFSKTQFELARNTVHAAHAEYERFKKVLEESVGISLSGKVIDDVTFEIKTLPENEKEQQTRPN